MELIDAHVHFWDLSRLDYPWLSTVPAINRSYLPDDYRMACGDDPVEAFVFVQAECNPTQYQEELRWVQALADADPRLQGIIPWAPLEAGASVAEELAQMAVDPRIKGVRRIIQFEPDTNFCLGENFVRGVHLLGLQGLHFELTLSPAQLPQAIKLTERCPGTRFILDHIGNPRIAAGPAALDPWRTHLKAFADSGPHFCKFSNLICNADLDRWTVEDLRPFADAVLDIFTPDRLIWGSDWPHALRAGSFRRWLHTAKQLTATLTAAERRRIFHDNATAFYRLACNNTQT